MSTHILLLFFLSSLFLRQPLSLAAKPKPINPQILVMGMVYCDICSNNTFSKHSYFLPGFFSFSSFTFTITITILLYIYIYNVVIFYPLQVYKLMSTAFSRQFLREQLNRYNSPSIEPPTDTAFTSWKYHLWMELNVRGRKPWVILAELHCYRARLLLVMFPVSELHPMKYQSNLTRQIPASTASVS